MSFDEEVDEVKREMQTAKLDPAARRETAQKLCQRLKDAISSKRLDFVAGETNGEPSIEIRHLQQNETLAHVFVNEDGSITFQAVGASESDDNDDDESGYFPSYVEYYDEEEFLEDARDILKVGVAEYELDREAGARA
jgi:hypothetical protein